MNYTQLLAGMVAGYILRPHIQKMLSKDAPAMGALHMNPGHLGALGMQQNPLHMGALHMNPAHLGALQLSGMHY
tara:strand:+ start:224 stop:445 length:222 start_codon:yes stop_codon:yes gene_type:complete